MKGRKVKASEAEGGVKGKHTLSSASTGVSGSVLLLCSEFFKGVFAVVVAVVAEGEEVLPIVVEEPEDDGEALGVCWGRRAKLSSSSSSSY